MTCSFDYVTDDINNKIFMIYCIVGMYWIPLFTISFFYLSIVRAVAAHEKALREQAKKMNVESLRSSNQKVTTTIVQ